MSSSVGVDLKANTGQATKELQNFSKQITGIAKVWENVMGGKGSRQASSNLQQLSKGVDQLAKSAEKANTRLQAVNTTLGKVSAQRKALEGSTGSVLLKDRDIYKALSDQEKSLSRQQKTWTTIAAVRSQIAANTQTTPGGGGGRGGAGPSFFTRLGGSFLGRATGGLTGAGSSLIGSGGAGAITEALGPALGALVMAGIGYGVKGFGAAYKQDETLVNFLPRMRPGQMGSTNVFGVAARLRGIGRPLAYNAEESLQTAQSMSEGGSQIGHGLERDTFASMQFSRMFGLDPSGTASMFASAQRSGSFKAGDAKKFASMLAVEIAHTGLGPRAEEVLQGSLMLMNRQVQELGGARPGPMLALQTALNHTGIPALQGMNGASFISRLQDAYTHPGDEGSQALNYEVFRKMGAKSLYQMQYLEEEGLNNPKYLRTKLAMVEKSTRNSHDADMALKADSGGVLNLHVLEAIRKQNHGRLSGFTGSLESIQKGLAQGGGFLDKGASTAKEAFTSLEIKSAQIAVHEGTLITGEELLRRAAGIAKTGLAAATAPPGSPQARNLRNQTAAAGLSALLGEKPGSPADKKIQALAHWWTSVQNRGGFAGMLDQKMHRMFGHVPDPSALSNLPHQRGVVFGGLQGGTAGSLAAAIGDMQAAGLHPRVSDAFRTYAMQAARFRRHQRGGSRYPAAHPGHSAHERGNAVDIVVPPGEREATNQIMAAHGFLHNVPHDPVHYTYGTDRSVHVHIHDHSAESHSRVTKVVERHVKQMHHDSVRSGPNTRNMRN